MLHYVRWEDFHGCHALTLRGPADGFRLSTSQVRRYRQEACGVTGCRCAGVGVKRGPYSATIITEGEDLILVPYAGQ